MSKKYVSTSSKLDIAEVRMRRFFAMMIDWYIAHMLSAIPITFYFRQGEYLQSEMFELTNYDFTTGLCLGLYGLVIGILYYVVVPSFVFKGQTIGKKICKVVVKRTNGTEVGFGRFCVRELIGATFLEGGIVLMASEVRGLLPLFGLGFIVQPWTYLAYGLTIVSVGYAYMHQNSRCFHDLLADTIVVKKD